MEMSKLSILVSVLALPFLSACTENLDFQGYSPQQYNAAHPKENKLETRHMLIDLRFKGTAKSLSSKDVHDLKLILDNINPHAVDYITLKFDKGMAHKKQRVDNVKKMLSDLGYNHPINIIIKEKMPVNKLVVDVVHVGVIPPNCPDWRKSPVTTFSNTPHTNYSCAATVNLGLMLENPRDLVRGRDSKSNNSERADKALSDYRTGVESTSGTATASTITGN